ncbi:MAG: hypothetical protein NDI94_07255 [Candidatus Woesearchaeota archaeon]|nr:hypothetical protein [Candidatus Woesearchaeota archaeon]
MQPHKWIIVAEMILIAVIVFLEDIYIRCLLAVIAYFLFMLCLRLLPKK